MNRVLHHRFTRLFKLAKTTQIKAKAFKEGYCESHLLSIEATKAELKPAISGHFAKNGVAYKYYEGYCQKVEDIVHTTFVDSGILDEPSIANAKQEDHFGYVFTGLMEVPEDGVYGFRTVSDDGSVLYIDHELVVDNDGSHAAIASTGSVALRKGFHSYTILYFEDYEGHSFDWSWKLPSAGKYEAIPVSALFLK